MAADSETGSVEGMGSIGVMGTFVIRGLLFFTDTGSLADVGSFSSRGSPETFSSGCGAMAFFRGRGIAIEEGTGRTLDVSIPRAIR